MKHLRKFNESLNKEELQDFCDTYLAYLLDDGYTILATGIGFDEYVEYVLVLSNGKKIGTTHLRIDSPERLFPWEEVKDQFIPFLHMLSKQYTIIGSIEIWSLNKKFDRGTERPFIKYDYSLSMVLEDRVSLEEIVQINIHLK